MKTNGTVIYVDGDKALVRTFKNSACAGCKSCANKAGCEAHFMMFDSPDNFECYAVNKIGAQPGDNVELYTSSSFAIPLAVIAFIMPVWLTVIAYFVLSLFLDGLYPVLCSIVVFFTSFVLGAFILNKFSSRKINISISKIIEENGR